ncbi:hypothetical protein D3C81_1789200 [compost metagenome]
MLGLQPEQLLELGVMNFIGVQVPVPQAQRAGLECQGQALFAFAQGLVGQVQRLAALHYPGFKAALGLQQLFFDPTALFDFPFQRLVEPFAVALGLLQVVD